MPILESNQNLSVTWQLSLCWRWSNPETRKSHEFCVAVKDLLELTGSIAADKILCMPRYSKKWVPNFIYSFVYELCVFFIKKIVILQSTTVFFLCKAHPLFID